MEEYGVVKRETIYRGRIVNLIVDTIVLPNNKIAKREIVHHADAAAVLAQDDDGKIFLVKQYRHAVGDYTLEIPAGLLEDGEEPEACALRELEEEIGYKANNIRFVNATYNSIGFCTEKCYLYIAHNLVKTAQKLDDDEFIEVKKYSLEECEKMISKGEICDGKTVMAILALKLS